MLLLVVVAAGVGFIYLRSSLPRVKGDVQVTGVSGPIEIVRDADAVAHIYASSQADAVTQEAADAAALR
ncbi:MAG TPA: hypothetical protein PKN52_07195, partial [Trueperaceae bacterium]|nr:hypothetical protein [Trueperaceae bacterium]